MPWPVIVTVLVAVAVAIRARVRGTDGGDRDDWRRDAGLLVSALAMGALTVTTVGITNRYLADFYPLMAVGVALGAPLLLPPLGRHRILSRAVGFASLLVVAWSFVVVLSLATRLVFD
jgi:hypothetical protein